VKTIRLALDKPRFVVQCFCRTVCIAKLDIGEDVVFVFAYGSREFYKWPELGSRSPGQPLHHGRHGAFGLEIIHNTSEFFLEQICSIQALVFSLHVPQFCSLFSAEIPGILQQSPARGLDKLRFVCTGQLLHDRTADIVYCIVGQLLHMKSIEDDLCRGCLFAYSLDECLGHIHGNDRDLPASVRPQLVEKRLEGVGVLALPGPYDVALDVIHDESDILVVFPVGDFVDSDYVKFVEPFLVSQQWNDPANYPANCSPIEAHQVLDGSLVRSLCLPGDHVFEIPGEPAGMQCPWYGLDMNCPTVRALDATGGVSEPDPASSETQMTPEPWLLSVVYGSFLVANSTSWLLPSGLDVYDETHCLKRHTSDNSSLDTEEPFEYSSDAHGSLLVESNSTKIRLYKVGLPCVYVSFDSQTSLLDEGRVHPFPPVKQIAEAERQSPVGPERSEGGAKRLDCTRSGGYPLNHACI